jgi:hypothetical protein
MHLKNIFFGFAQIRFSISAVAPQNYSRNLKPNFRYADIMLDKTAITF